MAIIAVLVAVFFYCQLSFIFGPQISYAASWEEETAVLIKAQIGSLGVIRTASNPFTISPPKLSSFSCQIFRTYNTNSTVLDTTRVATRTGVISANSICLSLGDYSNPENELFSLSEDNSIMKIEGNEIVRFKETVLCDQGIKLANDLMANGLPTEWVNGCPSITQSEAISCLVALRKV
ncbi:MAG: hypothetical protein FJY86_04335 [Candidatus Diapherotrites archaeon]|uniref:Uncharacterized protein n=1 Tax=Candidatus Iainarchaeum sp. TaxID=3101447 RepID=A0A8T4C7M3_9ARCH|nr:hypothetical protein [Candidatus Diapherotrites archaeon]